MDSEKIIEKLQKRVGKEQAKKNAFRQRLQEMQIYIQGLKKQQKELVQEKQTQEEQLMRLELHYRQQLFVKQTETIWQEFQNKLTEELLAPNQSFEDATMAIDTLLIELKKQMDLLSSSTLLVKKKKMEE